MRRSRTLRWLACWLAGLSAAAAAQCPGDFDDDGAVTISEVITAVGNALAGCPPGDGRFADRGDGTIADRRTGLIWEKKAGLDEAESATDAHDADDAYRWAGLCAGSQTYCQPSPAAAAFCRAHAAGDTTGCAECGPGEGDCSASETIWTWAMALNAARFAGYDDWRIPTATELQALVDYARPTPPMIDAAFHGDDCGATCSDLAAPGCACTHTTSYWSASAYTVNPAYAWMVDFGAGTVISGGSTVFQNARHAAGHVRAVRGSR